MHERRRSAVLDHRNMRQHVEVTLGCIAKHPYPQAQSSRRVQLIATHSFGDEAGSLTD